MADPATLDVQKDPERSHITQITNAIIEQHRTLTNITLDIWSNHLSILDPFAHIASCNRLQVLTITIAHEDQIRDIIANAIEQCKQLHTVNIKSLQPTRIYIPVFTNLENTLCAHKNIKNLTLEFDDITYCECEFIYNIIKNNNTISKYKFTGMRRHEHHLDYVINELKNHTQVVEFIVDSIYSDQINKILSYCKSIETFETEYIIVPGSLSINLSKFNLNTTLCNSIVLESRDQKYADLLGRNCKIKATKILIDVTTCLYKLNLTVYAILEIVRYLLYRYRVTDFFIVRTITKINRSIDRLQK